MTDISREARIERTKLSNSQRLGEIINDERALLGQKLQFGGYLGEDSLPGNSVTFTWPEEIYEMPHKNVYSSQVAIHKPEAKNNSLLTSKKYKNKDKSKNKKRNKGNKKDRKIIGNQLPLSCELIGESSPDGEITGSDKLLEENKKISCLLTGTPYKGNSLVDTKKRDKIIDKAAKKYKTLRSILAKSLDNNENDCSRTILGGDLPLGDFPMGYNSFPGPDITYTPPSQINNPMVSLGCLNSQIITDIVPIRQMWPSDQTPYNFATGSTSSQPNTSTNGVTNSLRNGVNTPFDSSVYLSSDVSLYGQISGAAATNYSPVTLSQEGILWTLWPLTRDKNPEHPYLTYFDDIYFGTAKQSKYPLGQLGFFINNKIIGCTPIGSTNPNSGANVANISTFPTSTFDNNEYTPGVLNGIESLNQALLTVTGQQVAIVVVKVSEQIARVENPESGLAADNEFIFVGYDGWAVVNLTSNPIGPMAAQTYITPQTVSGSNTIENMQVILPPNFPTSLFYKNNPYTVPVNSNMGLFMGTPFMAS